MNRIAGAPKRPHLADTASAIAGTDAIGRHGADGNGTRHTCRCHARILAAARPHSAGSTPRAGAADGGKVCDLRGTAARGSGMRAAPYTLLDPADAQVKVGEGGTNSQGKTRLLEAAGSAGVAAGVAHTYIHTIIHNVVRSQIKIDTKHLSLK